TLIESGNPNKVAIVIGDDRAGAPLLLYIGDKNFVNNGSFLDRNGLSHGKLYVWASDNGDLSVQQFNGTGNSRTGKFKEIAYYNPALAGTPGYDALGFANQATQDILGDALGAFSFSRPEDLATNPANGKQVVLASTGRDPDFPADKWGTTYIIDFNLSDLANPSAKLNILYAGDDAGAGQFAGPDFGMRSPDNLDWSENGLIYIQEDRSYSGFGLTSGQEASVWEVNPASGQLTRIAQIDRTAVPAGQVDNAPNDIGNWESSGIVDISNLVGATDEVVFLAVSQAHSVNGGSITANTLVEGGQLLLVEGTTTCELSLDSLYTACPGQAVSLQVPANFEGFSVSGGQLVKTLSFTQSGNYTINAVTVSGCTSSDNIVVNISGPTINLPFSVFICPGSNTVLDAGNPGATYAWSNGSTTQTISVNTANSYTVTVTNATGCSAVKTVNVNLNPAPVVNLPASEAICAGASVTLNPGSPVGFNVLWSNGASTQTITVGAAGTYSVTVTNLLGCSTTDETVVTVNQHPVVNLGLDTTICVSQTPWTISAGANFSIYRWSTSATTSSIEVVESGSYFVTVTDINGCTGSDDVFVEVEICSGTKSPGISGTINIFPNPTSGLVNLEMVQFEPADYQVTVFNIQGQLSLSEQMTIHSDQQIVQMDMNSFAQGTYLVKVSSSKGVLVHRLVVTR
ncbi:MAG: T9SS type A sorting domain-containing protein, partial [Saprospiraceae bacterium]